MAAKYARSIYFGNGAGHVVQLHGSDVLLFTWNGRCDGVAYEVPSAAARGGYVYSRDGKRYVSRAALLRAVASEHDDH